MNQEEFNGRHIWRIRAIDLVTRLVDRDIGSNFRRGVMETARTLYQEGDLRLIDVFTTFVRIFQFISQKVRVIAATALIIAASVLAGLNQSAIHRGEIADQTRLQISEMLSERPQPSILVTSARKNLTCFELKKRVSYKGWSQRLHEPLVASISLKLHCFPSQFLNPKLAKEASSQALTMPS